VLTLNRRQRGIGLAANRDEPATDDQRHAQDDEQRRRPMPNGPVDQRCEDNRGIDERTELDRRRVAVREHDEHLRKELRNSDTDQVDSRPWLERAPFD
jgi:hypothetical protein